MTRPCISAPLIVIFSLLFGVVANDADAGYSNGITRTVCPGGNLTPNAASDGTAHDPWAWKGNGACGLTVSGLASGVSTYGTLSAPFESIAAHTATWSVGVHGTDAAGGSRICIEGFAFDNHGNVVGTGGHECVTTSTMSQATLVSGGATVPVDGATLCNVAAENGATLDSASVTFIAGGL